MQSEAAKSIPTLCFCWGLQICSNSWMLLTETLMFILKTLFPWRTISMSTWNVSNVFCILFPGLISGGAVRGLLSWLPFPGELQAGERCLPLCKEGLTLGRTMGPLGAQLHWQPQPEPSLGPWQLLGSTFFWVAWLAIASGSLNTCHSSHELWDLTSSNH